MDLIILFSDQTNTESQYKLFSEEGLRKIQSICAMLASSNVGVTDVYIQMEVECREAEKIIDKVALWDHNSMMNIFFLLSIRSLNSKLIAYIDAKGFSNVVITCCNKDNDIGNATETDNSFLADYPESKIHFSTWIEITDSDFTYRRFSKLNNLKNSNE